MNKNIISKTITRIVCLLGLCIGLYKTDVTSILILFAILAACVWLIPFAFDLIFKDKLDTDGSIYVDQMTDGHTSFKLSIKQPMEAIKKDYLLIKVAIPKDLWEEDGYEEE